MLHQHVLIHATAKGLLVEHKQYAEQQQIVEHALLGKLAAAGNVLLLQQHALIHVQVKDSTAELNLFAEQQ